MTEVMNIKRKGPITIEQFMFGNACEKITLRTSKGDMSAPRHQWPETSYSH